MIEQFLQYCGIAFVTILVTIEALYMVIVPLLMLGLLVWHGWERLMEEYRTIQYRRMARKLLGDLRVLG